MGVEWTRYDDVSYVSLTMADGLRMVPPCLCLQDVHVSGAHALNGVRRRLICGSVANVRHGAAISGRGSASARL